MGPGAPVVDTPLLKHSHLEHVLAPGVGHNLDERLSCPPLSAIEDPDQDRREPEPGDPVEGVVGCRIQKNEFPRSRIDTLQGRNVRRQIVRCRCQEAQRQGRLGPRRGNTRVLAKHGEGRGTGRVDWSDWSRRLILTGGSGSRFVCMLRWKGLVGFPTKVSYHERIPITKEGFPTKGLVQSSIRPSRSSVHLHSAKSNAHSSDHLFSLRCGIPGRYF